MRRGEEYLIVLPDSVHRLPVAVRGRVTDEADRPLPYSNVLLLTPDSVFVNGCVSREDGSFLMTAEEGKAYLLKVSSVGYATWCRLRLPATGSGWLPTRRCWRR